MVGMTLDQPAATAPLPVYLGPTLPRWQPRSVADVQAAIDDGTLGERHWLDVKESVGSSDGAKKELARDLASFANDGGGLIIGVAEDKQTSALSIVPVELAGFPERVDQVARSRCDPPLYVQCHPLADPANITHGVLLVEVPPSPLAPHMVDGAYHGRGDKTKHKLTDAEVASLHARRTARQLTGEQLIAREVARSPILPNDQKLSHLFVVAQPLASPPDLVTHLLGTQELRTLVNAVNNLVPGSQSYVPNLSYAGRWLLAVGVTNLYGRYSGRVRHAFHLEEFTPYSENEYVQSTEAVTAELLERPGAVTGRLLHRLLRGLGDSIDAYAPWLKD